MYGHEIILQNHKPDDILFTRTKIDMLGHKDITKLVMHEFKTFFARQIWIKLINILFNI
ncbi:hypothetical protein ACJX0J_030738, partial [Zea mays]